MKTAKIMVLSVMLAGLSVCDSKGMELKQNCPNPFSNQTCIAFKLETQRKVTLTIYDLRGAKVRKLLDGALMTADSHEAIWDVRDDTGRLVSSGIYFCRLEAGSEAETMRMALVK
jgi:hypothetical protein